ncbi:D-alanine--D-alanine ligase [Clostridium sp. 19966]|uniref:D-alanine--D-alanine ligase n=1 Tax=Clostridium sp. 19966 TaxID=2768166 RepID=UPI0028DF57AE|nr:D-alanine--D-alanine ligase [Clostridium sp. 19966]MDT8718405.1 D-alanine--D-alanine ligase [Clostridium sp. 19966]
MKVGVLMGGISSEREISLLSGQEIVENLDKSKYEVYPIVINSKKEVMEKVEGMDFAFLAFHGAFGEDGSVQALLESVGMPYSGCGVLTSALCMDKKQAKRVMRGEGINVAPEVIVYKGESFPEKELKALGYPVVVKPNNGGSSIGTFLATDEKEVKTSIQEALKYDDQVLVEKYLPGEEYTVPILNGEVLPILSIKASGKFFDYKSKYSDGGAEEIIAELPKDLEEKMRVIGEKCWRVFGCKAYVRVDIIVNEGTPYVLELNTLPGMTKHSLFPKSARGVNISYSELLDKIIQYSLSK